MSKTATIRARIQPELKAEAEEILNDLGLTTSESIQLLFNQIRLRGEFVEVPEDHDPTDEIAAYELACEPFPGHFGIYYQVDRPSKQDKEKEINARFLEKTGDLEDWQILQQNFDAMM